MVSSGKDNCLELLATKTFLKVRSLLLEAPGVSSVLLQLNNATAVAYINNMGGKVSGRSGKGTMDLGTLQGYHPDSPTYPGSVRHHSKYEITTVNDKSDWMLCPHIL